MARTKKVEEVAQDAVEQDAVAQDAVAPAAVELVKMISGSGVTYDIHPSMVESAQADGLMVVDNVQA